MKRLHILISLFALILTCEASGQTLNAYAKGAQEAFEKKDYYTAYNFLRIAHEIEPNNTVHTYNLAEAARHYSAFTMAEKYYSEVDSSSSANDYPANSYWLGTVKERLGKYQEALDQYTIYLSEHSGEDPELTANAQKHIEICNWAIRELDNKDTLLTLVHLGPEVNTTFSEFGGYQTENLLYYSSLRFLGMDSANLPERPYSKILISKNDSIGVVDTILNDPNLHTSHTAFNGAKDRVFYTLCDYVNGHDIRCDIYYRDIVDGEYGLAQKLPEPINMAGYTNTQPHVGYDPVSKREMLYFVSDRPGGKGKLDIWYCYIAGKDNFTTPENLMTVNTEGSDYSPFYHRRSNTLYFSSEGNLGFGGLDIYSIKNNEGIWDTIVNLGAPINSSLDDAFYSLSDDGQDGYFSSNRLGSMYLSPEDEACCFDIYRITKPKRDVVLLVRTFETYKGANAQPLPGVRVSVAEQPNGTPKVREEFTAIQYLFPVELDKDMIATGTKKGYQGDSEAFNTSDPNLQRILALTPHMDKRDSVPVFTDTIIVDLFLEVDKIEVFLFSKIYFDNDEPGPSTAERTDVRYLETYDAYAARKDLFAKEYGDGSAPEEKDMAIQAISGFFTDSLPKGKRELDILMHILEQYLRDGKQISIFLKGYTSPLASAEYNLKLGKRRISSIQNEFKVFQGGILWKYMESGDLVVAEKSFGEETAPPTVSDDRKNKRKSIYSPEASEERRVEIVEIKY
ncbi:MAG: PD40 domain-containing protein [Saprospiraceae bacterium]|nr:PD40 domain-containing protein [Saprospiraceae bacterium]